MFWTRRRTLLAAPACVTALLTSGCFDGAELAACGITMTYCDGDDGSTGGDGLDATSSSTGPGIMTSVSLSGGSGGDTDASSSSSDDGSTSTTSTGEPIDPPPWIEDLACDPRRRSRSGRP